MNLLEKQFPVYNHMQAIEFKTTSAFAQQLAVHVKHLNKAVKEVTHKTTSELIMERIVQEAKEL